MAALNLAWIFWDLGRMDGLEDVLGGMPKVYRWRVEASLGLLKGDDAALGKALKAAFQADFPRKEALEITLLGVESIVVLQTNLDQGQELLRWLRSDDSIVGRLAVAALDTTLEIPDIADRETPSLESPRLRLYMVYIYMLALLNRNELGKARLAYSELQALMKKERLRPHSMPDLDRPLGSYWARALHKRLEWSAKPRIQVYVSHESALIQSADMVLERILPLARKPATFSLLRALAGPAGRQIILSDLHRALTKSLYVPERHESRLRKLILRLNRSLEEEGMPSIASFSGLGTVIIQADVIVQATGGNK